MKPFRFVLAAIALCAALPAAATVSTSYNFASSAIGATNKSGGVNATTTTAGATIFKNANVGQYGDGGTNYGNTITWGGSTAGSNVTVSAWSTTGGGNKFETAFIGNYGGDLGVTGQPRTGLANAELTSSNMPDTGNNQHAMDNVGAYDALLFSFQSAVSLADVSIGFPPASSGLDSDSTILYWNGTKAGSPSTNLAARTVADLTGNGWSIATNMGDMAVGNNATGLSPSISSQYWMVGAYMNLGGPSTGGKLSAGNDYIKVNGLTVTPRAVPEPGSLALFGIAAVAFFAGRRRKSREA